jgi:RNA polymerase sigma-70 factor (ECF subfamily)
MTMTDVMSAMDSLTDLQREVISLRFGSGLSVAETAQAVGRKDNAVKALQHAGLKKLRALMVQLTPAISPAIEGDA